MNQQAGPDNDPRAALPATEGRPWSKDPVEWTEEQIDQACSAYTYQRPMVCPVCGGAIRANKAPTAKPRVHVVTFSCPGCSRSTRQAFKTIMPEDFIRKPYDRCPKCGEGRFGLVSVHPDQFWKRCTSCDFQETYPLPELQKTVIYVDQLAISNMMFALNPETEQFKAKRVDESWLRLFEKLDRLTKLHLIICPDSYVQEEESLAHRHFEALRRTYEQLSHGVTFMDPATIERFQLIVHAANWLDGRPEDEPHFDREQVVHGDLNWWTDVLQIRARSQITSDQVTAIRDVRDQTAEGIERIFERWRGDKGLSFQDWFEEEVGAAGPTILRSFHDRARRLAELQAGLRRPSPEDIYTPTAVVITTSILGDFERAGRSPEESWKALQEYLASPYLRHVPSIRISSMLWAAVARKAAAGQKRPPSRGTANDIKVIASVLPYCDALFIDNEMRGYLAEEPLATELRYPVRVFSKNILTNFMDYLETIEQAAAPQHLALVERVYGKDWGQPFVEMFRHEGPGP